MVSTTSKSAGAGKPTGKKKANPSAKAEASPSGSTAAPRPQARLAAKAQAKRESAKQEPVAPNPRKNKAAKKPAPTVAVPPASGLITPEQRYRMICEAAYFRAQRRGFVGGSALDDWLAAEAEIDALLEQMHG